MLKKSVNPQKDLSLTYTFYNHVIDIPIADWNTVLEDRNIFLTIPYLKILEETLSDEISFKYLIFYTNTGNPIGVVVTQQIKFNTRDLNLYKFPCKFSGTVKNLVLKNTDIKVLVCGNLFACGENGYYFNSEISKREAFTHLSQALLEIKESKTSDKPAFILLKELWPESNQADEAIKEQDFRDFTIDVNMVMDIKESWKSFDDYLMDLKTKFRSRAKTIFKKSEAVIVKDLSYEEMQTYQKDIDQLYRSVIESATFTVGNLNALTFIRLKEVLKDAFVFKGYFLDQKIIGFSTAFIINSVVEANHVGIDYTYNKSQGIYQKMLYDYIDLAIAKQAKELWLGRTAETIKSTVGAKPVAMKLYVKHRNAVSNMLLKPFIEYISPSEYEIRNPFKAKNA